MVVVLCAYCYGNNKNKNNNNSNNNSFGSTRDDICFLVLGRIGFAVLFSCSFRFSWIQLPSANKSSLSATLVSILFLDQSPHHQVLSIYLQSAISLQLPPSSSPIHHEGYTCCSQRNLHLQIQCLNCKTFTETHLEGFKSELFVKFSRKHLW